MDGCIVCDGPLVFIGTLGKVSHYRCRNCGWDQNREEPPDESPNEDEAP